MSARRFFWQKKNHEGEWVRKKTKMQLKVGATKGGEKRKFLTRCNEFHNAR